MRLIRLLKNDIAREASDWVDEDLISESQAEAICNRYEVDYHQVKNRSYAYTVLVGLAGLFLGLAVITVLGANWEDIPRALRMGGLVLLTLVTQCVGLWKYRAGHEAAAATTFFLGNFFYGAAIILIAQIYHLGEHMPDGVFWWAMGCLPFALLTRNPLLAQQAQILALIWLFVETNLGFYPALFPVFIAGSLYVLLAGRRSVSLFLTKVISIGFWFEYSLSELWRDAPHYRFEAEHVAVTVGLFVFVYGLSHWLNGKSSAMAKDYGAVLALWSLRFGLLFMLVMSFESPWEELRQAQWEHKIDVIALAFAFSCAALWLAYWAGKIRSVAIIAGFYLLTLTTLLLEPESGAAIFYQVVYNLALVACGVWLIIQGIHQGISHYFFLGVATILITALLRYMDLIGDYIGGALLFAVFAILLLGAARYWKRVHSELDAKEGARS